MVVALAITALLVFAVGCGDDNASPASDTPTATEEATPSATPGPLPSNALDLAAADPAFVLLAEEAGDLQVSASSLAAGDFDGDGNQDLVIGASYADGAGNARPDSGEVHVIFDASSLAGERSLGEGSDLVVYGAGQEEYAGWSVAAGDFNGDGIDDLVIGAPGVTAGDDPRTDQGRVYVIFGSADLASWGKLDLADPASYGFVLTGAEGFSRAGHATAVADVNGDGTDDLLIGAPFAGREPGTPPGGPRTGAGALYIVFGASALAGEVNVAFENPDVVITNEERYSQFAASVAAGDVNGDGSEDIVVGGPQFDSLGRDGSGAAFIFYGPFEAGVRSWSDAAVVFQGGDAGDALGVGVAVADMDGDGRDDVVVSAPQADGPTNGAEVAGDTYIFTDIGSAGTVDLATAPPNTALYGRGSPDGLGLEVLAADIDGDGAADLVATAPMANVMAGSRFSAGEVVLLYSPVRGGNVEMALSPEGTLALQGAAAGDQLGASVTVLDSGSRGPLLVVTAARAGSSGAQPARIYGLAGLTR